VLLTAVRNEQEHVGRVLDCVSSQTFLPEVWVIVDTGSNDLTEQIVRRHALRCPYILFTDNGSKLQRGFAAKVQALRRGYELIRGQDFDYVGVLDADVSFGREYYEAIVTRFLDSADIGIAGGTCVDVTTSGFENEANSHVRGATQTFRRECFEGIGGLLPLDTGGEDTVAELMARMRGWTVRCYADLRVQHHRRTGTGECSIWRGRLRQGACDYYLGYHPLFLIGKCFRRITERPSLLGSLLRFAGYLWPAMLARERQVSAEVIQYLRAEQFQRLKALFLPRMFQKCENGRTRVADSS